MGLTSLKISFSGKHLFFQHLRYYYIYTKTTIMETSIFMHKEKKPAVAELKSALGEKHQLWQEIRDFVFENSGCCGGVEFSREKIRLELQDKR